MDNATLTRFFAIHFLLPFIGMSIVMVHLILLHQTGSTNPLGVESRQEKITFHPFFTYKDIFGFTLILTTLVALVSTSPNILGDVENFIPANPLSTPVHIQPEWYFLFAYAILRSIPNKLGGVLALAASIGIIALIPLFKPIFINSNSINPVNKSLF